MNSPVYEADAVTLYLGDCIEVMRTLPEASVDAVVTDPPYGWGFMGKEWDNFDPHVVGGENRFAGIDHKKTSQRSSSMIAGVYDLSVSGNRAFQAWCEQWAREAYRVLKPGGHLAAFGGPRTYHRLASGIEDAGFEVRDSLLWLFGSGFPKSLNVSKAIDRANGDERPVVGRSDSGLHRGSGTTVAFGEGVDRSDVLITSAASAASAAWDGYGTALKPAYEPIVLARKPLIGTVAANVLAHGTGALNIDGCRIGTEGETIHLVQSDPANRSHSQQAAPRGERGVDAMREAQRASIERTNTLGRWPANALLDEEAAEQLDRAAGAPRAGGNLNGSEPSRPFDVTYGKMDGPREWSSYGDTGGPSRFFYTAKASRSEREAGLEELEPARRHDSASRDADAPGSNNPRLRVNDRHNDHPTVKPLDLMRWICRLVTAPGGLILDPFLGSGTTAMAALDEGFRCVGIDREPRYIEIAQRRISHRHLTVNETREPTAAIPRGRLL